MRLADRALALLGRGASPSPTRPSRHLAERLARHQPRRARPLAHVPAADPSELTVVIPVRDRPAQLDRALAALHPLRCVVVDDASRDPERVAAVRPATRRRAGRRSRQNLGPAGARNAGLRHRHDALRRLRRLRRRGRRCRPAPADPTLRRSSGRPRRPAGRRPGPVEHDRAGSSGTTPPRRPSTLGDAPGVVRPGAAVAWLPSACLVGTHRCPRRRLRPRPASRRGRRPRLAPRRRQADGCATTPTVRADHDARPTIVGWLGRKAYYGSGGAELAARHGDRLAPAVLTPTYAVAAAALLLRRRWSWPVAGLAVALGWRTLRRTLPESVDTDLIAARLAIRGLGWAVRQEASLLLRHWWPLTALGVVASRHARRALSTALVIDFLVLLAEEPESRREPGTPLGRTASRRPCLRRRTLVGGRARAIVPGAPAAPTGSVGTPRPSPRTTRARRPRVSDCDGPLRGYALTTARQGGRCTGQTTQRSPFSDSADVRQASPSCARRLTWARCPRGVRGPPADMKRQRRPPNLAGNRL